MTTKYGNLVYTGCVKWFNRKGWGFITITNDEHNGDDVFVRWDNLGADGYKYLVQGEYVDFEIGPGSNDHEYQAKNVVGVNGGKLMCETRNEQRMNAHRNTPTEAQATTKPNTQWVLETPATRPSRTSTFNKRQTNNPTRPPRSSK